MNISNQKKEKIFEQILAHLYSITPKPAFTAHIAKEIARDEEFVKKLLLELKGRGLLVEIKKNLEGKEYKKRSRWKLGEKTYLLYKQKQNLRN